MTTPIDDLRAVQSNANLQSFLSMLSKAEGTDKLGYHTAFGGGRIEDLTDHPRTYHEFTQTDGKKNRTSAAGKYQFLARTWDGLAKQYGLSDFGPENQDLGAIALLKEVGALDDILKGDMAAAVRKSGRIWASLPSSPYAQPRRSEDFISKALGQPAAAATPPRILRTPALDAVGDEVTARLDGHRRERQAALEAGHQHYTAPDPISMREALDQPYSGPLPTEVGNQVLLSDEAFRQSVGVMDRLSIFWEDNAGTAAWRAITTPEPTFVQDFTYSPAPFIEDNPALMAIPGAMEHFARSRSPEHEQYLQQKWQEKMDRDRKLATGSVLGNIALGIGAGIGDPLNYVAGAGGMFAAARVMKRGYGSYMAGSAAGNVAYDAMRDAAGRDVTLGDYIASATLGAALGGLGYRLAGRNAEELARAERLQRESFEANVKARAEAAQGLGPNATDEDIDRAIFQAEVQKHNEMLRVLLADVDEADRIIPTTPEFTVVSTGAPQLPGSPTAGGPDLTDVLDAEPRQGAVGTVRGVWDRVRQQFQGGQRRTAPGDPDGLDRIENPQEREMIRSVLRRAEEFMATNPIDEGRLNALLPGVAQGMFTSQALTLLRSGNPVAMHVAAKLLENTTGAVRGRTAAITKYMAETAFMGDSIRQYNEVFRAWRAFQGRRGVFKETDDFEEFGAAVFEYREGLRNGIRATSEADVLLKRASDVLTQQYDLMRKAQVKSKVTGWGALSDADASTYNPWRVSIRKWMALSPTKKLAYQRLLSEEVRKSTQTLDAGGNVVRQGWSKETADRFAARWMQDQIDKPIQGNQSPSFFPGISRLDAIEETLESMGLTPAEASRIAREFTQGGAGHTRGRMERNMLTSMPAGLDEAGNPSYVRLMDVMDTDGLGLLQRQAHSVSGQVALAQFGVPSAGAVKVLRTAVGATMPDGPDKTNVLKAFDQSMAEMLGQRVGNEAPLFVQGLMSATSLARLGGMVFAQLSEMGNIIGTFGVRAMIETIPSIPRLFREVGMLARGEQVPGGFLSGIEAYTGNIGLDNYRNYMPHQLFGSSNVDFMRAEVPFLTRLLRTGQHTQGKISGWRRVHAIQERAVAEIAVNRGLRFIREGKGHAKALQDMGITEDLATRMRAELGRVAVFDARGNILEYRPQNGQDAQALAEFHQSVARGVKQIIQGTFVGEKGQWAHEGYMKFLTQFRTYSITSLEKQAGRQWANHGAVGAFMILLGAMSVSLPIYAVRTALNASLMGDSDRDEYLEKALHPGRLFANAIGYTAMAGLARDVMDVGGGTVLGLDMPGQPQGIGYGGAVSSTVPGLGFLEDAITALHGLTKTQDGEYQGSAAGFLKILPGGRMPYVAPVIDAFKKGFD